MFVGRQRAQKCHLNYVLTDKYPFLNAQKLLSGASNTWNWTIHSSANMVRVKESFQVAPFKNGNCAYQLRFIFKCILLLNFIKLQNETRQKSTF